MTDGNGAIRVTAVFEIVPEPLGDWDATTVREAARNLERWYEDGSASVVEDLANADNLSVQIESVDVA